MLRRGYLNCFLSLGFALAVGLYVYRPSTLVGLVMLLFFLGFGINFLWNMLRPLGTESERGTLLLLTLGFALIAFFCAPRVGAYARDAYFRSHLPELNQFVAGVVPQEGWQPAPVFPAPYHAHREAGDFLVVEFAWGGGFPARHTFLTYVEDERALPSQEATGATALAKIADHWFYLDD